MDTQALARQALAVIKERYGMPEKGFLAGGALANVMWSIHTGKPGPVNDIDIFEFREKIELKGIDHRVDKSKVLFGYKEKATKYFEDYTGISWTDYVKDLYTISSTENDGIFNRIVYDATTQDPSIVLKAFDLNCVKVGYHIDTDTVMVSKEFEEFLQTGKIRIVNLMTPAHTPMRIAKKARELEAEYDELEMKLATHALVFGFQDIYKSRFKERYAKMFEDEKGRLEKYFEMKRDSDTERWLLNNGVDTILWMIEPTQHFGYEGCEPSEDFAQELMQFKNIFGDENLNSIFTTREFLFYMRNVFGTEKAQYWKKLHFFYKDSAYLDDRISAEDADLLHRLAMNAPSSIENLAGMSAADQASTVKKLLDAFKEDPIVAISILEKGSFKGADLDDELTRLLLELGVRKEIVNDTKGKARKILEEEEPRTF